MDSTPAVVHVIDTLDPGGAQSIVLTLARRIPGQEVVAAAGAGAIAPRIAAAGARCSSLASSRALFPLALARLLALVLRHRRRAIINAHLDFSTLALCVLRSVIRFPLIVTVHALQSQWPRWYVPLFRRVISRADQVVVEDRVSHAEVVACGVRADRVTLIPIGTEALDQDPPRATIDLRKDLGLAPGRPIILNVARMTPGKGQAHLLRALAGMQRVDAVAIIVGDGPEMAHLRALSKELGLDGRVSFLGRRIDLQDIYPHADILAMPCLDESMGVVIYEALAYHLPIVAYDSGSIREVIEHGRNGFVVPVDPAVLARELDRVLDAPPPLDFSGNGRFSGKTMAALYADTYRRLWAEWQGGG